jgi:radical SAM family RiPP maturation amino acid epimerase
VNPEVFAKLQRTLEVAFRCYPEYLRPLIDPVAARDVPWASGVAHSKRLLEYWMADRDFRGALPRDPAGTAARYGLRADPEDLRFLWDDDYHRSKLGRADWTAPRAVQQYRAWIGEKFVYRERLRLEGCVPQDLRHRTWRERQIRRTWGQLGQSAVDQIIHAPFSLELSEGCSVGCWFCGVSAEQKASDFLYTEENQRLWRDVLTVLRGIFGPAAANGFCYWATDPLDNPDYERFALDFAKICGKFPQTTTAQPHKHIERVRALLRLSADHGCEINRFSILTLGIFRKVMDAFTAEELLHTELVVQNQEASLMQSNSGRARGAAQLDRKAAMDATLDPAWREAPGTIACVSGFLFNMVRRSVRLVTPCPSSDTWPNGYWICEEGTFASGRELEQLLEGMMRRHMRTALRAGDVVRFRPDLAPEERPDAIELRAYGGVITYREPAPLDVIGAVLRDGTRTAGEIVVDLEDRLGRPAEETMDVLNDLFAEGLLDEEPISARGIDRREQHTRASQPERLVTEATA